jgi:amino-acid N-acetyltransferase
MRKKFLKGGVSLYKTGRQRYEKCGGTIFYPTEIDLDMGKTAKNKKNETVKVILRKALMCDVKSLYNLFSEYSKAGEMLPRPMSDIYEHLRDFYIAEIENESAEEEVSNEIIGACALTIVWENLAEVRSLAVKRPYTRKRIGTELIKKCIEEAKFFKLTNIFALTYKPQFFHKSDFITIDKSELPHKIWSDCINCVKFPDCDETAVMLKL